ncbi:MAG: MFS transporter [Gammaproteobacteria bacterium]|nr:MFS transporter [Gammaproteobacteria bacterium]
MLASIARLMMGAGSAFAFIGTLYLILRWFPSRQFSIYAGLTQLMGSAGAIFGAAPMAGLAMHFGWRQSMELLAIFGGCLALLIFLIVRNSAKNYVNQIIPTQEKSHVRKILLEVISNKQSWYIALFSCFSWAPIAAFAGLWGIPFLSRKYGLQEINAGAMMAFVWIGVGLGSPLIALFSEKIKKRIPPLIFASCLGVISMTAIIFIDNLPLWLCAIFLLGLGGSAAGQALCFAIVKDINPIRMTSTAIGFNNMCIVAGAIFSHPLIGYALDCGWSGAVINGARQYSLADYKIALLLLPICYFLNIFISKCMIKETNNRRQTLNTQAP